MPVDVPDQDPKMPYQYPNPADALPETVVPEETGIVVRAGAVDELRAAIERMLLEPERTREMGRKARAFIQETYSPERQYAGIMGVDERLMAHTEADAIDLFARIQARQAGASPDGAHLTNSLLQLVEEKLLTGPFLRPLAPILVRMLNGDQTAAMLGLDVRHHAVVVLLHRVIAMVLRAVPVLIRRRERPVLPLRRKRVRRRPNPATNRIERPRRP